RAGVSARLPGFRQLLAAVRAARGICGWLDRGRDFTVPEPVDDAARIAPGASQHLGSAQKRLHRFSSSVRACRRNSPALVREVPPPAGPPPSETNLTKPAVDTRF